MTRPTPPSPWPDEPDPRQHIAAAILAALTSAVAAFALGWAALHLVGAAR